MSMLSVEPFGGQAFGAVGGCGRFLDFVRMASIPSEENSIELGRFWQSGLRRCRSLHVLGMSMVVDSNSEQIWRAKNNHSLEYGFCLQIGCSHFM